MYKIKKVAFIVSVAQYLALTSTTNAEPATSGKFFYVDFEPYTHGSSKVVLNVAGKWGDYDKYNMFVTTDETVVGLIDQAVPDSKIVGSKKYSDNTSLNFNIGSNSSTNKDNWVIFAEPYATIKTILKNLKWTGVFNKDNLKFRLNQYHREMSLD